MLHMPWGEVSPGEEASGCCRRKVRAVVSFEIKRYTADCLQNHRVIFLWALLRYEFLENACGFGISYSGEGWITRQCALLHIGALSAACMPCPNLRR